MEKYQNPIQDAAISIRDVHRTYLSGNQQEVRALRGISIDIARGSFIALKGRSGSGKTTLLNCIGGLDQPTSGEILVFGQNLTGLAEKELTVWRRSRVGFVFQTFALLPTLSAFENVELALRISGAPAAARRKRANECLDLLGLGKWKDHRPYELSGGQQQRVAIARSLANRPGLILGDEPTGELDSTTSREMLTLFKNIAREEGITILIATHDQLVDEYVDCVLNLRDGVIHLPGVG